MCFGAECPTCAKKTWRGCGNHVPSVFANVPEDEWCTCEPKVEINGKSYPPQLKAQSGAATSWLKNLAGGK
ncbi:hypothetical protein VTK26DRAFT_1178 [Humicola hyalothermophila]